MLRKYQNELLVLLGFVILLMAVFFKISQSNSFQEQKENAEIQIQRIEDIGILNKLWKKDKTIKNKLASLKSSISKTKVKKFEIKKNKANIILDNLNGSEINDIVGKKLASIAVQIVDMNIKRDNKSYKLELRCKW